MKVLLINGSPRWKGNTNRALEEAAAALEAEGGQTELVWIGNKELRGCIACGICGKTGDKHCVFAEDCCNELIAKAAECDGFIVGSPVYYAGMAGSLRALMDRMFYAGGTNFRVATVHYEFGQPLLEDERTLPMPGSARAADRMDFIRLAADALEPLLDRVTQIGICFSYPAENTPELDAKVLGKTKEVQLTGWEDHLVGADMAEELERRGCTKLPITVINDTPATYLSGSTTIANNYANGFAGLVNGTGTNTCCLLPVRAIE